MANNRQFNKSDRIWNDFLQLKDIRDNLSVHPKVSNYKIPYYELLNKISLFRNRIVGFILKLHENFDEEIPEEIIRDFYIPELEFAR